jgi:hypothetical protein
MDNQHQFLAVLLLGKSLVPLKGPQSLYERLGEDKIFLPPGFKPRTHQTEVSRHKKNSIKMDFK